MLTVPRPTLCSFLALRFRHHLQRGNRDNISAFSAPSLASLVPPSSRRPRYRQQYVHQRHAGYSGRLRSHTRPNQEAQETGRERSRSRRGSRSGSRYSRRGGPLDEGSGDGTKDNTREHRQGTPTDRVDSPVRKEDAEQPPPGGGESRRQLLPALGERLQLTSQRSTEHHRRHLDSPRSTEYHPQSSRDRSIHANTRLALASAGARVERAYESAQATVLRREARR